MMHGASGAFMNVLGGGNGSSMMAGFAAGMVSSFVVLKSMKSNLLFYKIKICTSVANQK